MRVLVCGGRDYNDGPAVSAAMAPIAYRVEVLIEGGAVGADRQGKMWAMRRDIPVETFAADWKRYGNRAGPIRNQRMLDEGKPDLVVAFPGGRGTADMVRRAKAAGVEVREVFPVSLPKDERE